MRENNIGIVDEVEPYNHTTVMVCKTVVMSTPAEIALEIATRTAISHIADDGEDTGGRQRIRFLDPDEVASNACAVAAALWQNFAARGWLTECPLPKKREKRARESDGVV